MPSGDALRRGVGLALLLGKEADSCLSGVRPNRRLVTPKSRKGVVSNCWLLLLAEYPWAPSWSVGVAVDGFAGDLRADVSARLTTSTVQLRREEPPLPPAAAEPRAAKPDGCVAAIGAAAATCMAPF